jgi:hypothetical protein
MQAGCLRGTGANLVLPPDAKTEQILAHGYAVVRDRFSGKSCLGEGNISMAGALSGLL